MNIILSYHHAILNIKACAHLPKHHWATQWLMRVAGLFFLYTSLTVPSGVTLMDTELIVFLQEEFPTWFAFLAELGIGMIIFALTVVLFTVVLYVTKKEGASGKVVDWFKKIDNKLIINFLNSLYFLTRWTISFAVAALVWFTVVYGLAKLSGGFLTLPSYAEQPVIMIMGILGIALVIASVHAWKKKIGHLFCIHCKI